MLDARYSILDAGYSISASNMNANQETPDPPRTYPQALCKKFLDREKEASTVIRKGLAIPHIIVEGKNIFKIAIVRAKSGIMFFDDHSAHIVFIIIGSSDQRSLHLKVLAAIAQITQNPSFDKMWMEAKNQQELRNIILLAERKRG